jgi:hypothetical protein
MVDEQSNASKFTHVGVTPATQRKVALLAKALDTNIYSLVEYWADKEWQDALKAGLVTPAMLKPSEKVPA